MLRRIVGGVYGPLHCTLCQFKHCHPDVIIRMRRRELASPPFMIQTRGQSTMLFLTRMFGVTGSDAERELGTEAECIETIVEKLLLLQASPAMQQHRPFCRRTHAKGTSARAQFEVYDARGQHGPRLAARLSKGIFATPGIYPAKVRFANAAAQVNSDFKPDVRSLSFLVDLAGNDPTLPSASARRQIFSLQNATTLPINDARALLAMINLLSASKIMDGLWSLPLKDKLRVLRTFALMQLQAHQPVKPYQQLLYGSNVPFRHGTDVVKYLAKPLRTNQAHALQSGNPNALQDELLRHLNEDSTMSSFEFGLQFLDPEQMTYWGRPQQASFWTENASVDWKLSGGQFHAVARLTLLPHSQLPQDDDETIYFDATGNAIPEGAPLGSINRARRQVAITCGQARPGRLGQTGSGERTGPQAMRSQFRRGNPARIVIPSNGPDSMSEVETLGQSGLPAE
jgi:hypothetical protein